MGLCSMQSRGSVDSHVASSYQVLIDTLNINIQLALKQREWRICMGHNQLWQSHLNSLDQGSVSHMIMLACRGIRLRNKISYLKTTSSRQLCNTEGLSLVLSRNKTILSLPLSSYTLSSSHSDFTLVLAYFYPRAFAHGVPLQGIFLLFLTGLVISLPLGLIFKVILSERLFLTTCQKQDCPMHFAGFLYSTYHN